MKSRIIIADDHAVVREGLRDIIGRTPDLMVVAEAADGARAIALARTVPADVMILDIAMPVMRGIQVLNQLRQEHIRLPLLFFSIYPADQYVRYLQHAGAQGFIGKETGTADLIKAVRQVAAGGTSFPAAATLKKKKSNSKDTFTQLSRREIEVMRGLLAGTRMVEIGRSLGISADSVSTYRRRLLEKLNVKSNAALAALANKHGYF
jgi:DNA-binding NarL/FixJ family response regulator